MRDQPEGLFNTRGGGDWLLEPKQQPVQWIRERFLWFYTRPDVSYGNYSLQSLTHLYDRSLLSVFGVDLRLPDDQMISIQSLYVIESGCSLFYVTVVFAEPSRPCFNPVFTSYETAVRAVIRCVVSDTVTQTLSYIKIKYRVK